MINCGIIVGRNNGGWMVWSRVSGRAILPKESDAKLGMLQWIKYPMQTADDFTREPPVYWSVVRKRTMERVDYFDLDCGSAPLEHRSMINCGIIVGRNNGGWMVWSRVSGRAILPKESDAKLGMLQWIKYPMHLPRCGEGRPIIKRNIKMNPPLTTRFEDGRIKVDSDVKQGFIATVDGKRVFLALDDTYDAIVEQTSYPNGTVIQQGDWVAVNVTISKSDGVRLASNMQKSIKHRYDHV
ncbi:hypothetical protein Tcan_07120 [Toxocara canis]|uniref:Uncharacterized protein n=1 Tax=Toxocara canis TaxID=6265 RepID=A0A0B2VF23_TOXCA|nr:hypothetical protein Tcan_07120 [Toxocara canis]